MITIPETSVEVCFYAWGLGSIFYKKHYLSCRFLKNSEFILILAYLTDISFQSYESLDARRWSQVKEKLKIIVSETSKNIFYTVLKLYQEMVTFLYEIVEILQIQQKLLLSTLVPTNRGIFNIFFLNYLFQEYWTYRTKKTNKHCCENQSGACKDKTTPIWIPADCVLMVLKGFSYFVYQ